MGGWVSGESVSVCSEDHQKKKCKLRGEGEETGVAVGGSNSSNRAAVSELLASTRSASQHDDVVAPSARFHLAHHLE